MHVHVNDRSGIRREEKKLDGGSVPPAWHLRHFRVAADRPASSAAGKLKKPPIPRSLSNNRRARSTENQRQDKHHQEDQEQDLRKRCGRARETSESDAAAISAITKNTIAQ